MDLTGLDIQLLLLNKVITYPIPESVTVVDLRKRSALFLPLCFIFLVFHLVRLRPDVVVSIWSFPSLLTGLALKLTRLKSKWVVRVANNPADQENGVKQRLFHWLYKHASQFIVLCEELQDKFVAYYPFTKNKTILIRNGFNIADLRARSAENIDEQELFAKPYMISVGSFTPQKRYDVLLKAYALIDKKLRIPLILLGDGPLKQELIILAKELGIFSDIIFKGFVKNPYPYVANAKLFVLASDYEGLCNAAIEAQCLGVPAVITDCPTGNREIVEDGETGYLVTIENPAEMADKITKTLKSDELTNRMARSAKLIANEKFKIEKSALSLRKVIEL